MVLLKYDHRIQTEGINKIRSGEKLCYLLDQRFVHLFWVIVLFKSLDDLITRISIWISHYDNTPMHSDAIFHDIMNSSFGTKICNIFLICGRNTDCGCL